VSFSSFISTVGHSISGLGRTIVDSSPKAKALMAGAAVSLLAIGYLVSGRSEAKPLREKATGIVSKESVVLPSDIFATRMSRSDGTTLYKKAERLTEMMHRGNLEISEVFAIMKGMKLELTEMVQVLALAKMNFPNDKRISDSPFVILDIIQRAISKVIPKKEGALIKTPSPKEVSLKEGALPKVDPEYKRKLILYMQGACLASDLNITEETYPQALQSIKILDLEMDRDPHSRQRLNLKFSTYELRTRCLVASKGQMPSFEAYTKSIDRKVYENPFSAVSREYASHEENYVPERVALHAQLTMRYVIDMCGLSKRFKNDEPTIYALSGNTAVGKSFMAKNDDDFMRGVDEKGEATGALNPDTVKALLRKDVDGITNQQIHIEGFSLNRLLADELHSKALQTSMVIDERLGTVSGTSDLIETARASGKKLVIKDIDAPLSVSALRVLGRDVNKDPCVPFGPIAGGYKAIREQRRDVIDLIIRSPEVKSYELYVMDESGRSGLAARKIPTIPGHPARLEIVDQGLFEYALSGKDKAEKDIEALKMAKVDEALYGQYAGKGVNVSGLQDYRGCSMEEALMQHSLVLPSWQKVGA